jgi:hypothetical protein
MKIRLFKDLKTPDPKSIQDFSGEPFYNGYQPSEVELNPWNQKLGMFKAYYCGWGDVNYATLEDDKGILVSYTKLSCTRYLNDGENLTVCFK